MTTTALHPVRRFIAAFTALTLASMPLSQAAYGAATLLSDQPLAAKVAAKPNLLYTFDDSSSMLLRYSPDFVVTNAYCRSTAGNNVAACNTGYFDNFTNGGSTRRGFDEPMHAAAFNKVHYNPNVWYYPPVDGAGNQASDAAPNGAPAGTIYKMMNAANTLNWARVPNDMYLTPPASLPPPTTANTTDLSQKVRMAVFCNTDWPRTTLPVGADPATWTEIGDVNGETPAAPSSSVGRDCRINGTAYADSGEGGADSAPAVVKDYNYPYRSSQTPLTKNAKFFYRNSRIDGNHANRAIWCKTNAAGWPKSTTNLAGCGSYTCTLGGTPVIPTSLTQTCNAGGTNQGPPWTYSPVGCDTGDPLVYQFTWSGAPASCVGSTGPGGECIACGRTGIIVTRNASCSITGVACGTTGSPAPPVVVNGNPACPNQPGTVPTSCTVGTLVPPTPCNPIANANCNMTYGGTGGTGGTTLLDDANGAGVTCRRNNNTGTYVSNRFTYPTTWPNGSGTAGNYDKRVNDTSCGVIPRTVQIPQYYNVIADRYCVDEGKSAPVLYYNATRTGAAYNDDAWRGFGRAGVCKTKNDLQSYKNPYYGEIARVGIVNDGRMFDYVDDYGIAGQRTYAQEMTNFANWWTYYRSRVLSAKTTTAIAFNIVDTTFRAGFHVMNASTTKWLDASDFTAANRASWYAMLFSVPIASVGAKTPTLDAMIRIGEVVQNGAGAVTGLPAHADPIPSIAGNPVSCTANYHILFTDGTTDQITLPTLAGEIDGGNIPAHSAWTCSGTNCILPDGNPANPERSVASLAAGGVWPNAYRDAATPTANTLADISLNFWMRDLRTGAGFENDVPSVDGRGGKDIDWRTDPAYWQHVNFSALSYGADGLLDAKNSATVMTDIVGGSKRWFTSPNFPTPPNNALFPTGNPRAVAVDDLWHATVNARGKFVFAETPLEIAYGLGSIISGISNSPKARVGATFASRNLCTYDAMNPTRCPISNDFIYAATIEPSWTGELKKVTIDTTTGAQGTIRWLAAGGDPALAGIGTPPNPGNLGLNVLLATPSPSPVLDTDNPWFASRRIVTRNVDAGAFTVVPFRYADLNTGTNTQLNTLNGNATIQQKMISYLRGGSTFGAGPNPTLIEGTDIGQFRLRTSKLGNISDSKPVVVGPARAPFSEAYDYGYAAYKAANSSRSLRVYVGANDGMFHVFNGEDYSGPGTGGTETWAYIPSGVFTSAFDEGGKARKGIQALTYQDGGAPIFKHHFYVNSPPKSQDVDFANCGSNSSTCTPDWRTIVVSGIGKGGNTYFAIDATNPSVTTEAEATGRVLWEFALPYSEFSFGKPVIAKTRAYGWVVIVASGYNNTKAGGDGKGHLYVLKASDGTLLKTLDTTGADTGSLGTPSGLAQISGYVKDDANQTLEQIYGGDLNGRLWRWDVSDVDPATWQAKTVLLANLTDPSSVAQPITIAPEIEIDVNNGIDRFVLIGTGRLLDASDLTTPSPEQVQTAYAIRDGTLDTPSSTGLPIAPRVSMASATGVTGVSVAAPNGWYSDLAAGQRIIVDPVAEFNVFSYAGTELQPDPCLTSLPAYIYARDYVSGESLVFTGGVQAAYFFSPQGAVGLELVALEDPSKSFPTIAIVYTKETNAAIDPVSIRPKAFGGGHRLSWRLLGD